MEYQIYYRKIFHNHRTELCRADNIVALSDRVAIEKAKSLMRNLGRRNMDFDVAKITLESVFRVVVGDVSARLGGGIRVWWKYDQK